MSFELKTPLEVLLEIKNRMTNKRLADNLTQSGLASRAGISTGTVKHFEKTGRVAFENLLRMALALGVLSDFDSVLKESDKPKDLFMEKKPKIRKRGKIK